MIRIILGTIVLIAISCISDAQISFSKNLSCEETNKLIQEHENDSGFVILDLRPESMFSIEHIENAIFHDAFAGDFDQWVNRLDRDKKYLLYCNMGYRSGIALEKMKQMGFNKLYHLYQGITEWKKQGYGTIKGNTEGAKQSKHLDTQGSYLGQKPPE